MSALRGRVSLGRPAISRAHGRTCCEPIPGRRRSSEPGSHRPRGREGAVADRETRVGSPPERLATPEALLQIRGTSSSRVGAVSALPEQPRSAVRSRRVWTRCMGGPGPSGPADRLLSQARTRRRGRCAVLPHTLHGPPDGWSKARRSSVYRDPRRGDRESYTTRSYRVRVASRGAQRGAVSGQERERPSTHSVIPAGSTGLLVKHMRMAILRRRRLLTVAPASRRAESMNLTNVQ